LALKDVTFIRIEDAVKMIAGKEHPDKPLVAFTFDDGFMDCYNIFAPVLEEFGVNAMFL
jgi:peptidoglycan/xylan/chitin deacetylase (PgdA/CDA1 family)